MVHAGRRPLFDTRLASLGCLSPPGTLAALEFPFLLSFFGKILQTFQTRACVQSRGRWVFTGVSGGALQSDPPTSQGCLPMVAVPQAASKPGSSGLPCPWGASWGPGVCPDWSFLQSWACLLPGPATLCPPPPPPVCVPKAMQSILRISSLKSPGCACHSPKVPHHAGATARPPWPCETFCPAGDSR